MWPRQFPPPSFSEFDTDLGSRGMIPLVSVPGCVFLYFLLFGDITPLVLAINLPQTALSMQFQLYEHKRTDRRTEARERQQ